MRNDKKTALENAKIKYQIAIDKNISESDILWARFNTMLTFNAIFIALITFFFSKDTTINIPILPILLPIFGMLFCFYWYSVTYRGFHWIDFWITIARKIEREYLSEHKTITQFDPINIGYEEQQSGNLPFLSTKECAYSMIVIVAIIYLLIFFYVSLPALLNIIQFLQQPSIFYLIR